MPKATCQGGRSHGGSGALGAGPRPEPPSQEGPHPLRSRQPGLRGTGTSCSCVRCEDGPHVLKVPESAPLSSPTSHPVIVSCPASFLVDEGHFLCPVFLAVVLLRPGPRPLAHPWPVSLAVRWPLVPSLDPLHPVLPKAEGAWPSLGPALSAFPPGVQGEGGRAGWPWEGPRPGLQGRS